MRPHPTLTALICLALVALAPSSFADECEDQPPKVSTLIATCSAPATLLIGRYIVDPIAPQACEPPSVPTSASPPSECLQTGHAPAKAELVCEPLGAGFGCEAWPQDAADSLQFAWSVAGHAKAGIAAGPSRFFACEAVGPLAITVTVLTRDGRGVSATANLDCSAALIGRQRTEGAGLRGPALANR